MRVCSTRGCRTVMVLQQPTTLFPMNHLVLLSYHLLQRHKQSLKLKHRNTKMQLASVLRHASLRKMRKRRHSRKVHTAGDDSSGVPFVKMRPVIEKEMSATNNQYSAIGRLVRSLCQSQLMYGLHDSRQSSKPSTVPGLLV